MSRFLVLMVVIFLMGLAIGCSERDSSRDANGNVINISDDDQEMKAAIEKAKTTFQYFEENWQSIPIDSCNIKFGMATADGTLEHIWFSPTKIDGDRITGRCANEPEGIPNLKIGDLRTLSRADVSDWMIVRGDQCYGGYTIRVLASRNAEYSTNRTFLDPPSK